MTFLQRLPIAGGDVPGDDQQRTTADKVEDSLSGAPAALEDDTKAEKKDSAAAENQRRDR